MKRLLKWGCAGLATLIIASVAIVACAAPEPEPPAATEPTQQAKAEEPTDTARPTNTVAAMNTPAPTATPQPPTPTPQPTETPKPITLSGTGQTATDEIEPPAPISVAHFTHGGQSNFIVKTFIGDDEGILINAIGAYDGERPLVAADPVIFDIQADGAWTIEIHTLSQQDTAAFSGAGDAVSDLFAPPKRGPWEFAHKGESNFIVYAHCAGGSQVVQNEIGTISGSRVVGFDDGPCFWEIQADGEWSLKPR